MIVKAVAQKVGGHVHVDVFVAPGPDRTYANCGRLTFREEEWLDARHEVLGAVADVRQATQV